VAFAELDNRRSDRVERLASVFDDAAVEVKVPADIHSSIWQKFLFIAPVSGVGAVTRVPVGDFRSNPESRSMLIRAMREVEALAVARGVFLADDAVEKTLAVVDGLSEDVTASMQRDIMEGRPSELADINGAVTRLGLETGVATPVNGFIYAALAPMEATARRLATDTD
jgi:2-dehydropantoate 2-reductase